MLKKMSLCLALILTMGAASASAEIRIAGGASPIEKVLTPVKDKFIKETGISVVAFAQGPDNALKDFTSGKVDAMLLFLVPEDLGKFAKKVNVPLDMASTKGDVMLEDTVVFIVNTANPVSKLTKEQLTSVFSGKVENWKAVGGAEDETIVVLGELTKGLTELASSKVFGSTPITKENLMVRSAQDVVFAVAGNKGAIGIASSAVLNDKVKALDDPKLTVKVMLYTKGEPNAEMKKLIQYMKK
jgi:phosphate transport system substrate-binding protein